MTLKRQADAAGIVGASGSGYPLSAKLEKRCDLVIANGAECEPLLYSDSTLIERHARQVIEGLSLAMDAVGAHRGILAIRQGERAALEAAHDAARGISHIEVTPLPDIYPIGDAHLLVHALTGRVLPEGGHAEAAGVLVSNVHTLWHLARSAEFPVTWRYVSVGGDVARPQVLRVPTGMPIGDLLALCGGTQVQEPVFLLGGPMQGEVIHDAEHPLDKRHGGLFVFDGAHPLLQRRLRPVEEDIKRGALACAGCRRCVDACPRALMGHRLEPQGIMLALAKGMESAKAITQAPLCSGCGVCEVVCPMELSPRKLFGVVKEALKAQGWENVYRDHAPKPTGDWAGRQLPRAGVIESMGLGSYALPPVVYDADLAPDRLRVPYQEGLVPQVASGDGVKWGAVIAGPKAGGGGLRVHAPMPGRVGRVDGGMIEIFSR